LPLFEIANDVFSTAITFEISFNFNSINSLLAVTFPVPSSPFWFVPNVYTFPDFPSIKT
jgi:hypothetical protein